MEGWTSMARFAPRSSLLLLLGRDAFDHRDLNSREPTFPFLHNSLTTSFTRQSCSVLLFHSLVHSKFSFNHTILFSYTWREAERRKRDCLSSFGLVSKINPLLSSFQDVLSLPSCPVCLFRTRGTSYDNCCAVSWVFFSLKVSHRDVCLFFIVVSCLQRNTKPFTSLSLPSSLLQHSLVLLMLASFLDNILRQHTTLSSTQPSTPGRLCLFDDCHYIFAV